MWHVCVNTVCILELSYLQITICSFLDNVKANWLPRGCASVWITPPASKTNKQNGEIGFHLYPAQTSCAQVTWLRITIISQIRIPLSKFLMIFFLKRYWWENMENVAIYRTKSLQRTVYWWHRCWNWSVTHPKAAKMGSSPEVDFNIEGKK